MNRLQKISITLSIVSILLSCLSIITATNYTNKITNLASGEYKIAQTSAPDKHKQNGDPLFEEERLSAQLIKTIINNRWSLTPDKHIIDNSTSEIITDETNVWFNIDTPDGKTYIITAEQLKTVLTNGQYTGNIAWEKLKE